MTKWFHLIGTNELWQRKWIIASVTIQIFQQDRTNLNILSQGLHNNAQDDTMKIDLGTYIQGGGEGIRQYMREEQFSNERLNKKRSHSWISFIDPLVTQLIHIWPHSVWLHEDLSCNQGTVGKLTSITSLWSKMVPLLLPVSSGRQTREALDKGVPQGHSDY